MGSISSYGTGAGKRYRVRYRDPARQSREKGGFTRKKDAEDYLADITVATNRGEYVDPKTAKLSIHELGVEWMANQSHLKPSSLRTVETAWRVHVEPAWGTRRIGEIRHSEVQSWVTKFTANGGKPRSATVVIRAFGVLAAILDIAVLDKRISSNPARGVKLPRKGKKKRAYLSAAQVELLAMHAGEHSTLVYVLAYTGIRWGEAIGLRLSCLDALRRRMLIEENAVLIGSQVVVGTPKTHERRSVPYPSFLSVPLARACEGKTRGQLVFGAGDVHFPRSNTEGGWFIRAVQAAQKDDGTFPLITPHDLRHTAASLAISAGANPKAVQRMLGHASAAMTLDTYADLFEDDLDAVSERMDAARAESIVGVSWGLKA
ncbi:site-specific integrase [Cryobacterium algoritolerans]|uniref:Site-specific integrase n=1 Tax=Cryobacterium algoritolerans TaxID=1259184 RepID=A0A4R8WX64_9MICO|nr:site-specific integrase [Cryobacterium algoritolerans]TFC20045.1 site-specific integrase [Cryobacterium algoritolerans]